MATNNTLVAGIAVALVALAFIAGSGFTGAATTNQLDFSLDNVALPEKVAPYESFTAKVSIAHTGTLPATFVNYDYRIWNAQGYEIFRAADKSTVNLQPGSNVLDLVTADLPKAGIYTVEVTIDEDHHFVETDEGNNKYTTTLTVA
ncbi:MAG TPA: hypothetical protein HA224_04800 [Nanoarchaeota archaeon]|nr:hypothetical protein [Nanoarchaeota archaeon]